MYICEKKKGFALGFIGGSELVFGRLVMWQYDIGTSISRALFSGFKEGLVAEQLLVVGGKVV